MARKEPLYPHVPKSRKTTEHHYKVLENKPYGTWRIEELWEGGTTRSPFVSAGDAIERERVIAEEYGFLDTLYLDNAEELLPKWQKCERAEALRRFPPAKKGRVRLLERYSLPEGGFVQVTKLGRSYTFTRGYSSLTQAPDVELGLTKDEATRRMADALQASVLEIEE